MKTNTAQKIAAVLIPAALVLGLGATAFADTVSVGTSASVGTAATGTSLSAKATARLQAREQSAVTKSQSEISTRVSALNAIAARINGMTHVNAATKASVSASVQATIASLTALETKIASDSAADLKTDMLSITQGTRVYMLLLPQLRILAAGDRAQTVADMFTSLDTKIQTRITTATTAGDNVSAVVTAEGDMTAKVADANVQASAAISAVSGLTPDNGNQTVINSNDTAIKTARADLKVSETDLKAAQADLKTITADLKAFGDVSASASASTGPITQ